MTTHSLAVTGGSIQNRVFVKESLVLFVMLRTVGCDPLSSATHKEDDWALFD